VAAPRALAKNLGSWKWVEATVDDAKAGAVRTLIVHLPGGARLEVGDAAQAVLAAQLLRAFGAGGLGC
jgi:hypothetical protein